MKVAVLHGKVSPDAPEDQQDELIQAREITRALENLGHKARMVPFGDDLGKTIRRITSEKPDFVFNLVESFDGDSKLAYLGARILEYLDLPYTGNCSAGLYYTADKVLTKKILRDNCIETPLWLETSPVGRLDIPDGVRGPFIIKYQTEHASVGIDETSLVEDRDLLCHEMERRSRGGTAIFAEQFINGREFNVSLLEQDGQVKVFTPQEVCFEGYPQGKPRMITYRAKWMTDSLDYKGINKRSTYSRRDMPAIERMAAQARRCWDVLQLGGYARVDFRMDQGGNSYVIDINANPCLTHDSNFIQSLSHTGLSYEGIVRGIIGKFNRS